MDGAQTPGASWFATLIGAATIFQYAVTTVRIKKTFWNLLKLQKQFVILKHSKITKIVAITKFVWNIMKLQNFNHACNKYFETLQKNSFNCDDFKSHLELLQDARCNDIQCVGISLENTVITTIEIDRYNISYFELQAVSYNKIVTIYEILELH
jgi:hypothetical protein